jgi:hypothetical protein
MRRDFLLLRLALQHFCREVDKETEKSSPGSGEALADLVAGCVAELQARWRLLSELARLVHDRAVDACLRKVKVVFRRWKEISRMCMRARSAAEFAKVVERTEGLIGFLEKAAEEVPAREAS